MTVCDGGKRTSHNLMTTTEKGQIAAELFADEDTPVRKSTFIPKEKVAEFSADKPEVEFEVGTPIYSPRSDRRDGR